ncbi:MAG: STN domain-containing protein, partial [Bacteroidales bacterium]|nr:STN domain-containing protein [Bacteroidales bacterium]
MGQSIEINAVNEPLNQVLMEMVRDYGIQLSFDDQLLSGYSITVKKGFHNPEEAITFLIKDYPLDFKQI